MSRLVNQTAIIGAGALGATYGSLLYAMDPASVCLIASDERYNRLQQDGVTVNGITSRITVLRPEEATPVDLLIVAVKYHHLDQAIAEIKQAVGPATIILSVMNGIDSEERIGAVYGMDKLLYGLTLGIDAVREHNAVTYSNLGRVLFGERQNSTLTDRVKQVRDLFTRAAIAHEIPLDMLRSLWFKYMINVGVNQVSAVMGLTYGAIRASSEAKQLMDAAMGEVISLAQAMQIDLAEQDIAAWYKVLETLGDASKTSMLQDVEAGRKTEVEMLAGTAIALGRQHGIPTPVNQRLFDELQRIEAGYLKHSPMM
ncbi:ketopantoate reductase [Trichlorobacter thiogenes]|uniref:2-dehydropantoate 2-reductase n=1 Tax=Trichlorobacter thiogenes TaxID=115783 RepID=A0A1T4L5S8_9BACT|nr:ketopantoate reductase family protein [Trichlorobacter thiogenes]SJZ49880.1 ketopantoate reductase [Trichlorobacter thiogenes]